MLKSTMDLICYLECFYKRRGIYVLLFCLTFFLLVAIKEQHDAEATGWLTSTFIMNSHPCTQDVFEYSSLIEKDNRHSVGNMFIVSKTNPWSRYNL